MGRVEAGFSNAPIYAGVTGSVSIKTGGNPLANGAGGTATLSVAGSTGIGKPQPLSGSTGLGCQVNIAPAVLSVTAPAVLVSGGASPCYPATDTWISGSNSAAALANWIPNQGITVNTKLYRMGDTDTRAWPLEIVGGGNVAWAGNVSGSDSHTYNTGGAFYSYGVIGGVRYADAHWTDCNPYSPNYLSKISTRLSTTPTEHWESPLSHSAAPIPSGPLLVRFAASCARTDLRGVGLIGHGFKRDALVINQAATATLAASPFALTGSLGSNSGWYGTGGAALTEVAGSLHIVSGAGGAGEIAAVLNHKDTLAHADGARTYRFAKVRIRSVGSANQPFTFGLRLTTPPYLTGATGADGVWKEVIVDLAYLPQGAGLGVYTENGDLVAQGPFVALKIGGLAASSVIEVASITYLRAFEARAACLNGVTCLADAARVLAPTGTITGMAAMVNNAGHSEQGWSAAVLNQARAGKPDLDSYANAAPFLQGDFLDSDFPSWQLGGGHGAIGGEPPGGGCLSDGTLLLDKLVPATFPLEQVWSQGVTIYPGAGDVFSGGGYNEINVVSFTWLFGGAAYGLAVQTNLSPMAKLTEKPTVTLTDLATGAAAGIGVTNDPGFFATETPWALPAGRGHLARIAAASDHPVLTLDDQLIIPYHYPGINDSNNGSQRVYLTFAFHPTLAVIGLHIATHRTGLIGESFSVTDGIRFRLSRSGVSDPALWEVQTQITAVSTDSYLCFDWDAYGRLLLLFQRSRGASFDVWRTTSDDDGLTWSTPIMAIANGQYPINRRMGGDVYLEAAYLPTDAAKGTISATTQASGDVTPSAPFTMQGFQGGVLSDLIVQPAAFSLDQAHEGPSRWLLYCLLYGETATSTWGSANDGRSFTRIGA